MIPIYQYSNISLKSLTQGYQFQELSQKYYNISVIKIMIYQDENWKHNFFTISIIKSTIHRKLQTFLGMGGVRWPCKKPRHARMPTTTRKLDLHHRKGRKNSAAVHCSIYITSCPKRADTAHPARQPPALLPENVVDVPCHGVFHETLFLNQSS